MKKFILGVCLFLFVFFIPVQLNAANPTALFVNGVDIMEDSDFSLTCGSGTATYVLATNTLTLVDTTLTEAYTRESFDGGSTLYYGLYADGDINIVVTGTNTMSINGGDQHVWGVYAEGSIDFSGSGSLTISFNEESTWYNSIVAENDGSLRFSECQIDVGYDIDSYHNLTIENGASVAVHYGDVYFDKDAVVDSGTLVIDDGCLHGCNGSLSVSGTANVSVTTSMNEWNGAVEAICVGHLQLSGGEILALSFGASEYYHGALQLFHNDEEPTLTVTGGKLTAITTDTNGFGLDLYGAGPFSISGGNVIIGGTRGVYLHHEDDPPNIMHTGGVFNGKNPDGSSAGDGGTAETEFGSGTPIDTMSPLRFLGAGGAHSSCLFQGSLYMWGSNYSSNGWAQAILGFGGEQCGQLGLGAYVFGDVNQPTLLASLSGVVSVDLGDETSAAIKSNGDLYMWGYRYGADGYYSWIQTRLLEPTKVSGISNVVDVSCGSKSMAAVTSDGSVYTWGDNTIGQLGYVSDTNYVTDPTKISGFSNAVNVEMGENFLLILNADGTVYAYGDNTNGQLGTSAENMVFYEDGTIGNLHRVSGLNNVISIAVGDEISMALTADGSVYTWGGYGSDGPKKVTNLPVIAFIEAGGQQMMAVAENGDVYAWGGTSGSYYGQLGLGNDIEFTDIPLKISGLTGIQELSVGLNHVVALDDQNTLYTWGSNSNGRLGLDACEVDTSVPNEVLSVGAGILDVSAGENHSIALTSDGSIYTWGGNDWGQLGLGDTLYKDALLINLSTMVPSLSNIEKVILGTNVSAAVDHNGKLYTWGSNSFGRAAIPPQETPYGTAYPSYSDVPIWTESLSETVIDVDLCYDHGIALTMSGDVYTWGRNAYGQLGIDNDNTSEYSPVKVDGLPKIIAISAGYLSCAAVDENGYVWVWGDNTGGWLGTGTTEIIDAPQKISSLPNVVDVALGEAHILALKNDGSVYVWGDYFAGNLGLGSDSDQLTPVRISSLSDIIDIDASGYASAAVCEDGTAYCWGYNNDDRLGIGDAAGYAPVAVDLNDVISVSIGGAHSLFLTANGNVYASGANAEGQLGLEDVSTAIVSTPIAVADMDTYHAIPTVNVTGVSLNRSTASLSIDSSITLTATVLPADATNPAVNWSSSNTSVATVTTAGKVTALAEGSATITVETVDGNKKATCIVTVSSSAIPVTSVTLNKTALSLTVDDDYLLIPTINPFNATNKSVTWSSSNSSVVSVDFNGRVNALAEGESVVTVRTVDGNRSASCTVTVTRDNLISDIFFTDVKSTDWFYSAVYYMAENNYIKGMTSTTFGPYTNINRAMVVTILWRMEGEPNEASSAGFADLTQSWYIDAVNWAAANGIVYGKSTTVFEPNAAITRQDMATILYRYTGNYKGYDVSASASLGKFNDANKISNYALTAFRWAVAEGLINGLSETSIGPQGVANRAQFATLMHRFLIKMDE